MTLSQIDAVGALQAIIEGFEAAIDIVKENRRNTFLSGMAKSLREHHGLTDEQIRELARRAVDGEFQEHVLAIVMKAIFAESNLGVRILAILSAEALANGGKVNYELTVLMRAAEELVDEELRFVEETIKLADDGKLPFSPTAPAQLLVRQDFLAALRRTSDQFTTIVESLKRHHLLADEPSGFMDTIGSYGTGIITDRTRRLARYVRVALAE